MPPVNSVFVAAESDGRIVGFFHERLGGRLMGEKTDELDGGMLTEVAYGWDDLRALLKLKEKMFLQPL